MSGIAAVLRLAPPTRNGSVKPQAQAQPIPRRRDDDHDSDFRQHRRVVYVSNGGHDGHGPGIPLTVLVSVAGGVAGAIISLLTFGQGQIDRALAPVITDQRRLEAAVDSKVSEFTLRDLAEVLRENDSRIEKALAAQAAQNVAILELVNEMRRTYRALTPGGGTP